MFVRYLVFCTTFVLVWSALYYILCRGSCLNCLNWKWYYSHAQLHNIFRFSYFRHDVASTPQNRYKSLMCICNKVHFFLLQNLAEVKSKKSKVKSKPGEVYCEISRNLRVTEWIRISVRSSISHTIRPSLNISVFLDPLSHGGDVEIPPDGTKQ